eukprot:UN25313
MLYEKCSFEWCNRKIWGAYKKKKKVWPIYIRHRVSKHSVMDTQDEEKIDVSPSNLRVIPKSKRWHPNSNCFGSYSGLQSCALTRDCKQIIALELNENGYHEWEVDSGEYIQKITFKGKGLLKAKNCKLTSNDKFLVAQGQFIAVYTLNDGLCKVTIKPSKKDNERGLFTCFDISEDGQFIAVGYGGSSQDFEIRVFELNGKCYETYEGLQMPCKRLTFTADGKY